MPQVKPSAEGMHVEPPPLSSEYPTQSSRGGNPAPGYAKYPDHRIATKPAGVRVRVLGKGEVIADTRNAIEFEEARRPTSNATAAGFEPFTTSIGELK